MHFLCIYECNMSNDTGVTHFVSPIEHIVYEKCQIQFYQHFLDCQFVTIRNIIVKKSFFSFSVDKLYYLKRYWCYTPKVYYKKTKVFCKTYKNAHLLYFFHYKCIFYVLFAYFCMTVIFNLIFLLCQIFHTILC